MADAVFEQALADIRTIPTEPQIHPALRWSPEGCCTGDHAGWQWHQCHKVPACQSSRDAYNTYMRTYLRGWRARRAEAR
ncbi:hypothetical protein [Streptomyces sp. CA-111067]|uniref:hypothetical protein n=1 Tax=Streptomyces sp. CA-111067 TaxID=3240046 RepID=UPI003D98E9E4